MSDLSFDDYFLSKLWTKFFASSGNDFLLSGNVRKRVRIEELILFCLETSQQKSF